MKLKRLEIQGFKSFADKTEIVFEEGTTAIVGPNGSGKSNISDAVRWVLGEQSAKQLRGAKMEDVIFGGTEKRKALSWCEVSLLFENDDRALGMDCAEVLVTRRVWRSGESEYYLNKAACRLKDITELFRDTGIGKEGYSLIGQGRIDAILGAKSEDRRIVFEEAAGIVTYRSRKEEAERRMANTRANLDRVEDILSELEGQLEPLRQQAEDAKKYLALRDTLRGLELNAFLINHDRHKERINQCESLIEAIDTQIAEVEPKLTALSQERDALSAKADAADAAERESAQRVLEAARAVESQEGTNNVLRERILHAEGDARREEAMALEESQRAGALDDLKGENQAEEKRRARELADAQKQLADLEAKLAQAQKAAVTHEDALETHKADIMTAMNRMSDMKTQQARLTALQENLTSRLKEAEASALSIGEGRQGLVDSVTEAEGKLAAAQDELAKLEAEARGLDEAVRAAAQESEALLASLREKTAQRHQADSRLKVLREMERDYEGYQNAVRHALKHAKDDNTIRGVVANILRTPKDYERALEMVLGGALQNIITEDEQAAKRMIEYLRQNKFGRATFLPMTTVRGRTLSQQERQVLGLPGCVGIASELVGFDEPYRGIVESLLGRTIIAEDLDAGIQIMRQGRHAFRLVTLGGDVMHSGGSMTGGSVQSRMTSLLSREREIAEHSALLKRLEKDLTDIQSRIDVLDGQRSEAKRARNAIYDQAHQAEIAVARETEHTQRAGADLASHDERQEQAELLTDQLRTNLADIEEQLSQAQAISDGGETNQADMHARTAKMQQMLSDARTQLETLREETVHCRVSVTAQERELDAVRRESQRLLSEEGQLSRKQEKRGETQKAQADALARDKQQLKAGEAEHAARVEALEKLRIEQSEHAQSRHRLLDESRAVSAQLETLRAEVSTTADKRHRTELQLVRVQSDLKSLQERIWNEYELTYAGALEYKEEDFELRESEKRIASIRAEIREMGSVNVNAVESYAQTKERFESMDTQKQDLLKASIDLENIIAELLVKMERRFRKQFAQLNMYFGKTFEVLFGGGKAELKLGDDTDILNCNIDIVAQPPGKRLQLLSLLSGGERALTAIAILFAMLQLKPTPFCILDEIEAALDEANVANFADYLNEFSRNTQFVVVTHRRGTMERCQALYGVAMEEKGVSRMVSVKLTDVSA